MIQKLQRVISALLLTAVLAIGFCTPSYAVGIPVGEWKLKSLNGTSPVGEKPITLKIDGDKVAGLGGCNYYFSNFNGDDSSQIKIGYIIDLLQKSVRKIQFEGDEAHNCREQQSD